MYTEQIELFKSELDKRRINGDFENNELIYCSGVATMKVFITGKSYQVKLRPDVDNTSAIDKFRKLIDKQISK